MQPQRLALNGILTSLHGRGSTAGTADVDPYLYRLLLSLAAVNLIGLALLAVALTEGWIGALLIADASGLVRVIVIVFLIGFAWCASEVVLMSQELNALHMARPDATSLTGQFLVRIGAVPGDRRASLEKALRERLGARLLPIRHLAGTLVLLGLIGTVIGFVIALAAVDPENAADVSAVAPMVSRLIEGLGVALHTTLVGATLNIWLMLNYRILESGMGRLYAGLLERGARDE